MAEETKDGAVDGDPAAVPPGTGGGERALEGFPGDRPVEPPGTPGDIAVGEGETAERSLMDEDADGR